ncbi:PREDICTED: estradiol 17-beta-dehydrogenase 11-like [Rhagoletis zephyria]|uniref:estradiol 17-beta-dehydrogenase 11-like n=1 Tax=Rhagoletis zephyria TaxID=28612 RepID=UPI0008117A7B|nr:PREDICTED: estradiol 17-beta-dehydrogenase 11-like [Rhagoletis zephyria]
MGTKVIVWDINKEGIQETIEIVETDGGYCKGYVVDISKKEEVYKAAEVLRNEVGDVSNQSLSNKALKRYLKTTNTFIPDPMPV